jgi:hypothetical protein
MKTLKLLLLLLLIAFNLPLWAQFGIRLGLNVTNVKVDLDNSPISIETEGKLGVHIGVFYETKMSQHFSFQPELLFFQKGYRIKDTGDDLKLTLNYIEIPLLAKYNFNETKANVFLLAGPAVGIGISSKAKVGDDSSNIDWEETELQRIDFGLNLGGGVALPVNEGKHRFLFQARYLLGITNISDSGTESAHNRGFSIGIGYQF